MPLPTPATLQPASLTLNGDGTPWSAQYDDIYHSNKGALLQAEHVFLRGNGLPERWRDRSVFVVLETGFGLGHNFLATWQAWRDDPQACARLHFISVEQHPFSAEDLGRAHAMSGAPSSLSQQLRAHWPMLLPGFHRIELDGGRVVLTLLFGEAAQLLPQCVARADAIYLDGFAPQKNPDMWSPAVFAALAKLSHGGTSVATWSVSPPVLAGLAEAGFEVRKTQGFTGKHHMLTGEFRGQTNAETAAAAIPKTALVIGAGLAGTAITERLAARSWQVTLVDAQAAPAQGASGNFAGAFRPQPSRDDNLMARVTRAGFAYQLNDLATLAGHDNPARWSQCGVLHLARDAVQAGKQMQTVESQQPPADFMQWLDAESASRISGRPCAFGGWWFPRGGWISPPSLCAAHLALAARYPAAHIETRFNSYVARVEYRDQQWHAYDKDDEQIASAAHLILANAHDAHRLLGKEWLPLYSARGQVSHIPAEQFTPLDTVICGSGYLTPAIDGWHALGATFLVNDPDTGLRAEEHSENLSKLDLMLPGTGKDIDAASLGGRASLRPVTPDRLPHVGALPVQTLRTTTPLAELPREPQLWLLSGFGARGLVWGMLCAELLASQINDEPLPLERELVDAMDAARYLPRK
ncbi:bifunctional tRNA (5-methylaminomethyl-2-thiouridine)(34)-methyltransferase MnmD/FAD-dependent 5-carboxymethylaminomethyl-2-thiouridine(34) oxidoreductase MnmC [Uliginosibacterium sp. H3]|uniref:tRNA 5-methylaminomethyl-2-thiouridine biosynthesis bifunctional protein MnmC n=1 Tax=Uliginosibacterium silvisoli TaxID=3114758 RepID=A0ABU6K7K7_9RHOO|nr:bifunctional tRNA (5-methylaminomethyl-2-thiouridine)(34)-methyltransferase MnmD/FAD-dependent 5-carboxymethylaminomethyl-2-thiouridine(34) oxidoreductase MnmC [Uliginosibacterium sp. H3]